MPGPVDMRRSHALWRLLAVVFYLGSGTARPAEAPAGLVRAELAYRPPERGAAGTVRGRPRPDYDADGLPLGAFRLYPSVEASTVYDSNVFRAASSAHSDVLARIQPSVRVESDWSRHRLTLLSAADLGIYARNATENFTDGRLEASGVIDIRRGLRLEATAGLAHLHEERGSVDGDGGAEPVTFMRWGGQAALAGEVGRFGYRAGADYANLDYRDVAAVGGGSLNQDDRDHQALGGFARLTYAASADTGVFIAGRYGIADFAAAADDSGVNRDSHSQSLVAGVEMDWGGISFGQVYAGWFSEQFDDAALDGASGFTAGGEVTANVTPLTTITLQAGRELQATVTPGASSLVQTRVQAGVDHELLRNLLLNASVQGRRLAFEGTDRTDDLLAASLGADWLLNRYARLALQYDFDMRNSHGQAAVDGWRRHTAAVRLLLQR